MLKSLSLAILATFAFSGEVDAPKLSKEASQAIDKAIESNLTEPNKLYDAYQASLAKAQSKVIASLEKLKADASDVKKGTMSLKDRSSLVDAIDAKIVEIRKGALGEKVVAWRLNDGDLLGGDVVVESLVGTWKRGDGYIYTLNMDGTGRLSDGSRLTWKAKSDKKHEFEIFTNGGLVASLTVYFKGKTVSCQKDNGQTQQFDKVTSDK